MSSLPHMSEPISGGNAFHGGPAGQPVAVQPVPPCPRVKQVMGGLLVFAAAFFLYLSSAAVRWAKGHVDLAPAFFVFTRFFLGFVIVCLSLAVKRQSPRPRKYGLLLGRAIANAAAVYCFYTAVSVTSLAQANVLNMTYPVFVALFAWMMFKDQRDPWMTTALMVAFVGIYMVLARGPLVIGWSQLWGLASGLSGAVAVLTLNASRRWHDTETILFYLFGVGAILIWFLFPRTVYWPNRQEAFYLLLCSGLAIAGQYCMTYGHRYVTAVEGSILGSSRILLAACLGPLIASDPPLSLRGWAGAALIFAANLGLTLRKSIRKRLDTTQTPTKESP